VARLGMVSVGCKAAADQLLSGAQIQDDLGFTCRLLHQMPLEKHISAMVKIIPSSPGFGPEHAKQDWG
jgi:hypothetical protein